MFRKSMACGLLLGAMFLTGCHLESDAVVVQNLPNGEQRC